MVYQLVYLSHAKAGLLVTELEAILKTARHFNPQHGITGMLLYGEGYFVQLLEGEKADVQALFQRIAADSRHEGVDQLLEYDAPTRICGEWAMAFKETELHSLLESHAGIMALEALKSHCENQPNILLDIFVSCLD